MSEKVKAKLILFRWGAINSGILYLIKFFNTADFSSINFIVYIFAGGFVGIFGKKPEFAVLLSVIVSSFLNRWFG